MSSPNNDQGLEYFEIQPESGWIVLKKPLDVSISIQDNLNILSLAVTTTMVLWRRIVRFSSNEHPVLRLYIVRRFVYLKNTCKPIQLRIIVIKQRCYNFRNFITHEELIESREATWHSPYILCPNIICVHTHECIFNWYTRVCVQEITYVYIYII